jgi:hypothetical protein
MKKSTLAIAALAVGFFMGSSPLKAQTTLLYQNFETSQTIIPTGWTQQLTASAATNGGWVFGNAFSNQFSSNIPSHTYYALVDDYDINYPAEAADHDTLYSPVFSCVGQNHVFISFDLLYYVITGYETANLIVSNDGGKTWATVAPNSNGGLPNNNFTWMDSLVYDISSYAANKPNVKVAIAYFNGCPNPYNTGGGIAVDNIHVFAPLNYDLSVTAQNLPFLMKVGTAYTLTGVITNFGGDSVVSLHMNYSVNGGAVQTDNITGITGFNSLTQYTFSHNIKFTPSAAGTYTIKYWADNLNGTNADQLHANDTLSANFMAITAVQPKMVMFEELMNASCDPCLQATPNIDSVLAKTTSICNTIRYHYNFPGRDFMDDETYNAFVSNRADTFYLANGVPNGYLDGLNIYPGYLGGAAGLGSGYLNSPLIQEEAAVGSPFAISITSATYTPATQTFSLSAKITSYGNFPAGIKARVILSVDTITYKYDQSEEDPLSTFQPPLGSTSAGNGGNPDSWFPYVTAFPDVAEDMMPGPDGTGLNSFTAGSSQTINVSWVVDHPWGSNPRGSAALGDTSKYDSTSAMKFTVFLQDDAGEPANGIPAQYVYQSAASAVNYTVGMQEISNGVYFKMFPNPTTGNTNIVYNIAQEQNVNIEVFNVIGEKVYSANLGKTTAGQHSFTIDGSGLQSGVYMVKFITDNASTTQRLVIQQ